MSEHKEEQDPAVILFVVLIATISIMVIVETYIFS